MTAANGTSALWRRLDTPGHDACVLLETDDGWELDGCAVFRHESHPAQLTYLLACDRQWVTVRGQVRGRVGPRAIDIGVTRTPAGVWTFNGRPVLEVEGCSDLDFGFTPATNLPQLRRVAAVPGQSRDLTVAWLDVASETLEPLRQRYERRTETTYWYESPTAGYSGLLELESSGFVRRYPRLWEMEPQSL